MSIEAMAWAFEQKCGDPAAKLVLLAIADFADSGGFCAGGSLDRVADKAEMSGAELDEAFFLLRELRLLRHTVRILDDREGYQLSIQRLTP